VGGGWLSLVEGGGGVLIVVSMYIVRSVLFTPPPIPTGVLVDSYWSPIGFVRSPVGMPNPIGVQ